MLIKEKLRGLRVITYFLNFSIITFGQFQPRVHQETYTVQKSQTQEIRLESMKQIPFVPKMLRCAV
jgi:hypothetical protein